MSTVGIVETGGPKLNGVVCHNCRFHSRCLPDDITIAHGSQFADVVKVLRPFMVTPGLTFLVRSSSCMRSLFPIMTCSSNRPQRGHRKYPLFEGDSSCSTCKISRWILFYSNHVHFIATTPLPWPPDSGITIIDDWCRRYHSRENPVVVSRSLGIRRRKSC